MNVARLLPCLCCKRPVRVAEAHCPFCGEVFRPLQRAIAITPSAASRSAIALSVAFAAGSQVVGCSGQSDADQSSSGETQPPANANETADNGAGGENGSQNGTEQDSQNTGGGNSGDGNSGGANMSGFGAACDGFQNPAQTCITAQDCGTATPGYSYYCDFGGGRVRGVSSQPPTARICAGDICPNCTGTCAGEEECVMDRDDVGRCRPPCDSEPETIYHCVDGVLQFRMCDEPGAVTCGDGFRCDPADPSSDLVGCAAWSCKEGYQCWGADGCDPNEPTADPSGCFTVNCESDADCGCGYCLGRYCRPTLGSCRMEILAMPYGCVWPDDDWV